MTHHKPRPLRARPKDRWRYQASEVNTGNGHPLFWSVPTLSMEPFPDGGGYGVDFLS